ncbi:dedicator of cytokinesis protein 9-like isoform X4 [Argiope bruennichi]|uniref:dedicator of cytokinesis protein 9-like isoform X4 n=1 Tax=Argiope bruennichi TaxID=94029 RepID=UPI002494A0C0|nr:dedicator of cytokinesis protein 9-like isoform X4 [Argiope bruennichi]
MAERKFTRSLNKPGSAAQVRETVSQAVRESTLIAKPQLIEPVDFEVFFHKNKTLLQNDPLREMLLFPQDDVVEEVISRTHRTVNPTIPVLAENEVSSLFTRQCLKAYIKDWHVINYKYKSYSGSYLQLPRFPRQSELEDQVYEVDTEIDGGKDSISTVGSESGVIKEGFLLKGPESGTDSFISLATKSFKRRFVCLRQEVDGTHILEFHKDDRKTDSKGALCMDFCNKVVRSSKRSKLGFELQMADGHKSCILAAENERELELWLTSLNTVITNTKNASENSRKPPISPDSASDFMSSSAPSPFGYGTLKGLEHSKNPELAKYARETDYSIALARKENRQNLFAIYPDMQRMIHSAHNYDFEKEVKPYKEEFGTRILVKCEEISFRLQAPLESEKDSLCQVEPYITTLAIYDAKRNRKVSEDFKFDVNNPYIRNMLPMKSRKCSVPFNQTNTNSNCNGENNKSVPNPHLRDIGEEWLAFPKQAIFNVQHPESELYFVLRIEKVLQGSISQAADPYIRAQSASNNGRLGAKVQKIARSCCQRLGHYRMPFAWAARPIFKPLSDELDTTTEFGPLYRQEGAKLSDEDLLRFLSEFKKPEKLKHLTIIPGSFKFSLQILKDLPPNCLNTSLVPLIPFPIPPKCEPTIEIEQFPTGIASSCNPYVTYINHLYVFPKSLKYDGQKTFTKARNIVCSIEFRDSDDENAEPLKIIYGVPGESIYCSKATTSITHHNINPDFYKEVKMLLPTQLHEKHHILFTFHHISCEQPKSSKRRDIPVANVVGYCWLPLLNKGRLSIDDQNLSVSINLPPGYLSCKPLGLGKGFSGPEIRWVDGGKELFKVSFILVSTVNSKDHHLHNFFSQCQRLRESKIPEIEANNSNKLWGFGLWDLSACPVIPSLCQRPRPQSMPMILPVSPQEDSLIAPGSEVGREVSKYVKVQHGMTKTLKTLHAVDMSTIIHFLPTLLNELFHLIVMTSNEDVALNTVRVLIHIVHGVHEAGKNDILHTYVQYVFKTQEMTVRKRVVHEELVKSLNIVLKPANTDFLMINKFLRHSWFFFQIINKSSAQHLLSTERIKMLRQERFPADYQLCVKSLVENLVPHILQKHKELPIETKQANISLAFFLKKCLSLMDRGFVFKLIKSYLEKFVPNDVKTLHEYKFEFLEIICFHEHFIALNLPIMRSIGIHGQTKNMKETCDESTDFEHEYRLSDEFCRHHFLLGTLLQEIRASLCEVHDIRQTAISVFKNLLAKHAFDDRYQGKAYQARIASLYLPFISILIENYSSLHLKTPPATPPAVKKAEKLSTSKIAEHFSNPVTPVLSRRSTVEPTGSLPASARNRDSSFLGMIAGQAQTQPTVTFANGSCTSIDSNASNPSTLSERSKESEIHIREKDGTESLDDYKCHARSHSLPFSSSSSVLHFDKMDSVEIKDLLVCFLYIIKHVNEELLIGWWQHCSEYDILDFFQILELCLHQFKYMGKKNIKNQHPAMNQPKSMTLPARTPPPSFAQRCNSTYSEAGTHTVSSLSSSDADTFYRALLEANMATEVGLIALDVLGLYCLHLKEQLLYKDGDNPLMKKIFDIYLSFLQVGQSEKMFKHLFAALRAFINKFTVALFQGNAILCGKLCFELLRCCNSKLQTVRNEACALLYLLMRSNFEFSKRKELTRVHLQLIVSVSRLLGDVVGLNNARLQESLSVINNYANSDKAMQNTVFPSEVKDLTKRIRTVLMATMQMKEHENDPEMLVDLQHQLANSYASTPALRKTWLESMARNHLKNGDHSEAAHCYIHIAAMEAEYLKQKCIISDGCSAFKTISQNVEQDESNLKEDAGVHDIQYSQETLLKNLEICVKMLEQAERYEVLPELYKLIIPIYEEQRNYEALLMCYKTLHSAYAKIVDVNRTGRRLLGKYYRVAFFGASYFVEEAGKEYIYKEPKVTSLAEISERLYHLFCEKFGKDAVRMIMDSNKVNPKDLESKYAYIQVTHVVPYFDEDELRSRPTEFERSNNLRRFMFETPFTVDSNKARGLPEEQCKRRTILTTLYSFPYVKKRIPVFSKSVHVLSPIEVAIDEMQSRINELEEVVTLQPTDIKKLQLKLQGSISVQVNAGPLAYANAFLEGKKPEKYPTDKIMSLKEVYRRFIKICREALELNGRLITSDQYEYHMSLKKNFQELVDSLSGMLHEKLYYQEKDVLCLKRTSLDVFNYISGSPSPSSSNA